MVFQYMKIIVEIAPSLNGAYFRFWSGVKLPVESIAQNSFLLNKIGQMIETKTIAAWQNVPQTSHAHLVFQSTH